MDPDLSLLLQSIVMAVQGTVPAEYGTVRSSIGSIKSILMKDHFLFIIQKVTTEFYP